MFEHLLPRPSVTTITNKTYISCLWSKAQTCRGSFVSVSAWSFFISCLSSVFSFSWHVLIILDLPSTSSNFCFVFSFRFISFLRLLSFYPPVLFYSVCLLFPTTTTRIRSHHLRTTETTTPYVHNKSEIIRE